MPFKIIQTIERGKMVLTCVPHQWEHNGILYWPKKQQQPQKLQRDENSQPNDTWNQLDCVVKRLNIKSFKDGEKEIDIMSNNSETEPDAEPDAKKRRIKFVDVPQGPQVSYNIMAEESLKACNTITIPDPSISSGTLESLKENVEQYVVIPESNNNNQSDSPLIYSCITSASEEQYNSKSVEEDIKSIKNDIKSMNNDITNVMETLNTAINNQNVIFETLKTILLKVTEIQVQNEGLIKKATAEKRSHELGLKPIKDVKDLEEFEKKLTDTDYREDLKRNLSALFTKGVGRGITSAYAIIDILFERQFFKSCSWTGASRSQDKPTEKICFKGFTKTINFFYDIIHEYDSSFNLNDCYTFFKTILRNADQRCNQQKRASTKKCRGKKKDTNKPENPLTKVTPSEIPPISEEIGNEN